MIPVTKPRSSFVNFVTSMVITPPRFPGLSILNAVSSFHVPSCPFFHFTFLFYDLGDQFVQDCYRVVPDQNLVILATLPGDGSITNAEILLPHARQIRNGLMGNTQSGGTITEPSIEKLRFAPATSCIVPAPCSENCGTTFRSWK